MATFNWTYSGLLNEPIYFMCLPGMEEFDTLVNEGTITFEVPSDTTSITVSTNGTERVAFSPGAGAVTGGDVVPPGPPDNSYIDFVMDMLPTDCWWTAKSKLNLTAGPLGNLFGLTGPHYGADFTMAELIDLAGSTHYIESVNGSSGLLRVSLHEAPTLIFDWDWLRLELAGTTATLIGDGFSHSIELLSTTTSIGWRLEPTTGDVTLYATGQTPVTVNFPAFTGTAGTYSSVITAPNVGTSVIALWSPHIDISAAF